MKQDKLKDALVLCNSIIEDTKYAPDVYDEVARDIKDFAFMIKNYILNHNNVTERQVVALKIYKQNLMRLLRDRM